MPTALKIAFVCVRNAGRSQMATAYADRERDDRGLEEDVRILSGGTHPADEVHEVVVEAMAEEGIDPGDRTPREISADELESCEYVMTMGCSTLELAEDSTTEVRDWDLTDPNGCSLEEVREIREDVRGRVEALFDELERGRSASPQ